MRYTILLFTIAILALAANEDIFAQDNENVEFISRIFNQWEIPNDIVVEGNLALIATSSTGLQIVDISNPEALENIGYINNNLGRFECLQVVENLVYAGCGYNGFRVIDIGDPQNPIAIGFCETPGSINDIAIADDLTYLADMDGGLRIIDISNPEDPSEVGFLRTTSYVAEVELYHDFAFVQVGEYIHIIDINDPANPEYVDSLDYRIGGIEIFDNYLYVSGFNRGLFIVDISNPEDPQEIAFLETPNNSGLFTVSGDYAYLRGLRIIDISDPENPEEVGFFEMPVGITGVDVSGNFAYYTQMGNVLEGEIRGLYVLDVTDKESPEEMGSIDSQGWVKDVKVVGNLAYIVKGRDGLSIVNIGNIENPFEVGTYKTPGTAQKVTVEENFAYIADHHGGVRVIDISDTENLEEVGNYDILPSARDLAITEEYLFVISGDKLWILDRNDPENLEEVCQFRVPEARCFSRITVTGNYAYIVDDWEGLFIIDITDAEQPEPINRFQTRQRALCVAIQNDLAFLADHYGIYVINISDPENIEEVLFYDTPRRPVDIRIIENTAYICQYRSNDYYYDYMITILDINEPENIEELGFYDVPVRALKTYVTDELIFVAEGSSMGIYRFTHPDVIKEHSSNLFPTTFCFLPAYPNPFNSTTTIKYSLPFPTDVSLDVYNPLGRKTGTLFEGYRQPGIHTIILTANDLPSGLYFIRLESSGQVINRKVMLIK
ncbi:MAG: T9SS type A sorting domain-containing protein [Candidatus Hatepunaea meridiana]|nr:T9SS type A sorting domain-containing protein [Candidatus Hatepunaea meridiana]